MAKNIIKKTPNWIIQISKEMPAVLIARDGLNLQVEAYREICKKLRAQRKRFVCTSLIKYEEPK